MKIFLLLILSLLSCNAIGQNMPCILFNNISENDLFQTKILASDSEQYYVEVTTKDLNMKETVLFGEKYSFVDSKDCQVTGVDGNPSLPVYSQHIALPECSSSLRSVSIEELKWDTITAGRIVPLQPSHIEGKMLKELIINRDVYEGGWYHPEQIQTTSIQVFRGIKNTNVNICPFKYNAVSGKLIFLKNFKLKVTFTQDKTNKTTSKDGTQYYCLFDNLNKQNNEFTLSKNYNKVSYDYLIIVGDIPNVLESEILKDFRMWKALRGIRTKVVAIDSIGNTDTGIKAYIQSQYISDNIKYVLFIGKPNHIPQHIMSRYAAYPQLLRSDYWYGCMDGIDDIEADIAIGRYSVNSLEELENAMKKTIKYEIGTNGDGRNVLLVAHQQNAGSSNSFQNTLEDISNNSQYSNFSFIKEYGAQVASGGTGATSSSVVERINQGVGVFNYRGHAGPFFWRVDWTYQGYPLFDSLMVSTLSNEKYPVSLSITCETGRMDSTGTCLMDLCMNGEYGISSGLASTSESWHTQNNYYNKKLYSIINSENEGLGYINIEAHMKSMLNSSNYNLPYYMDNAFSYCCFGDPSLKIWTDSVKQLPEPTIDVTSTSFVISLDNIMDYDIIVASESNEVLAKYHSTSSNISIPLPNVSCSIAIHKTNYQSFLFDYIATSYVQNKAIKRKTFTTSSPLNIGHDVSTEIPTGNVVIEKGGILQLRQNTEVSIPDGFECKEGGQLIIN